MLAEYSFFVYLICDCFSLVFGMFLMMSITAIMMMAITAVVAILICTPNSGSGLSRLSTIPKNAHMMTRL